MSEFDPKYEGHDEWIDKLNEAQGVVREFLNEQLVPVSVWDAFEFLMAHGVAVAVDLT